MAKNIVLCSDGTGQSGTNARGTNVWKIRMGVDRHDHGGDKRRQVVFYDAGVGTSALSVKRALGGAFGYGLAANMRELYSSLAKVYDEGDFIYIFGFSRGAFTARSLAGMISEVGVIDGRRDNEDLEKLVKKAYDAYRGSRWTDPIGKFKQACKRFKNHKGKEEEVHIYQPDIHFVGVWDTVDAYGMPIDELNTLIYKWILGWVKRPHQDQLTGKMTHAFHAMAIDEDRKTFAPTLYDERNIPKGTKTVEQVWFAGAHSNVGGGYPRQGLSDEALEWMMTKAEQHGLRFTAGACDEVHRERDGNSLIYDQRSGPGVIWRYKPRDIEALSKQYHVADPPKIHVSAMDRIELGTAGYGPITLPTEFEVVGFGQDEKQKQKHPINDEGEVARFGELVTNSVPVRQAAQVKSKSLIKRRTSLYYLFLLILVVIAFFAVRFHVNQDAADRYARVSPTRWALKTIGEKLPATKAPAKKVWGWASSGAQFVVPTALIDPFIAKTFEDRPEFILGVLLAGIILFIWHKRLVKKIRHQGIGVWRQAFQGHAPPPGPPGDNRPPGN